MFFVTNQLPKVGNIIGNIRSVTRHYGILLEIRDDTEITAQEAREWVKYGRDIIRWVGDLM